MPYTLLFIALLMVGNVYAQLGTPPNASNPAVPAHQTNDGKRSLKIRKRPKVVPFAAALSLPQTATSCDCPSSGILSKLGCQHPDTAAICKVVVTEFDLAILPENEPAILLRNIKGSFLTEKALQHLQQYEREGAFISYSNIRGMTDDGKTVVVPSFGTHNSRQRATRAYHSIYDFVPNLDSSSTEILSFELLAYDAQQQMVFKQRYDKHNFDAHAIRPDAVRYVFREVQAQHKSGFLLDVAPVEVHSIQNTDAPLLSANE